MAKNFGKNMTIKRKSFSAQSKKKSISAPKKQKIVAYETDFYAWTREQASFLKKGKMDGLDFQNLSEEIESLGKSDKRALRSYLKILLLHLLKIRYQPKKRSKSWDLSVQNARDEIHYILEDSPSLKNLAPKLLQEAYPLAKRDACKETKLKAASFPQECPWEIEEVLTPGV